VASDNFIGNESAEVDASEELDQLKQFSGRFLFLKGVVTGWSGNTGTNVVEGIFTAFVSGSTHFPDSIVSESIIAFFK
jgi:hypothetical protein